MTVCVGLLHKDYAILASDSLGVLEDGRPKYNCKKIIETGAKGYLAISGTLGAGQKLARLLGQHVNPLDVPFNEIPDEPPYCLYLTPDRKLLEIDCGFGVSPIEEGEYACIGCGCDIARTSMMKQIGKRKIETMGFKETAKIVEIAIKDTCSLNIFCGGDVVVKIFKRG